MNYNEIAALVMSRLVATKDGGAGNPEDHMNLSTWEWHQGVAMYAMMKVYLKTRNEADLADIKAWYAQHIRRGLPVRNINTTAPMLALTMLYEETKDETYRPLIEDWANWVMTGLPRTEEGGFQHITTHDVNEEQIWDDTLFMTVLFLYRAGVALGRKDWREEAKYQFLLHIKYLHSQKTGLWYHGFCFIGRHHFGEAYWAAATLGSPAARWTLWNGCSRMRTPTSASPVLSSMPGRNSASSWWSSRTRRAVCGIPCWTLMTATSRPLPARPSPMACSRACAWVCCPAAKRPPRRLSPALSPRWVRMAS